MARKKEDNLIPYTSDQSREEASKNGRKGGIASGIARRKKKSMKELAKMVNSLPLSEQSKKNLPDEFKNEEDATYQLGFILKVYAQAVKGDVKAMRLWIDLSNPYSEERDKLELKKLKAEINKLNNEMNSSKDIEDLTPLIDLLSVKEEDENDNNQLETIKRKT